MRPKLKKPRTSHFSCFVPTHISYIVIRPLESVNGDQLAEISLVVLCISRSLNSVKPSKTVPAIGAVPSSIKGFDTASLNNPTLLCARTIIT